VKQGNFYYKSIKPLLIKLGLERAIDYAAFKKQHLSNRKQNEEFLKQNPDFVLPPDYMLYEAYQLNYQKYFDDVHENWIINEVENYFDFAPHSKVLEWGCGPARLIRNLPNVFPECSFYGTDYNEETINWCSQNIPNITFKLNELNPPLDFQSNFFDLTYNVSVFTHLNETLHYKWMEELARILKSGGLLVLTFHGEVFTRILSPEDQARYLNDEFVEHTSFKDGHRSFASFQPFTFMKKLVAQYGLSIIEHKEGKDHGTWIEQDLLICKKQ